MLRKEGFDESILDRLATWMIVATLAGARLGHTLFYEPGYYLKHPIEILKIWEGGLASHGAAIAIIVTLIWFARKNKWDFFWLIDRIAVPVALSGFFIRIGNLMNSEIFGRSTTLPWGFVFVRHDDLPRHPSQLYEALSYLLIFIYLLWFYYHKDGKPAKRYLLGMFFTLVFGVRIVIEFLKEPQVAFERTMTLNMGQLLSIPFVVAGLYLVFSSKTDDAAKV